MEEKMIDLETGKTIRIKKNAEGETEIIDGEVEEVEETELVEEKETVEEEDEVVFELPEQEEDDEELASLTAEEAEAYKKAREAKQREIEEKGKACLEQGNALFAENDKVGAEKAYREAMDYLGEEPEILLSLLRIGTNDFTSVDRIGEFRNELDAFRVVSVEEREAFLSAYGENVNATLETIRAEKNPLQKKVEDKRRERGVKFGADYKKATKNLLISSAITVVSLVLLVVLFSSIYRQSGLGFLIGSIVSGVVFLASLVVTLVFTNKFQTARHRVEMNGDNAYSNDGRRLNVLIEQEEFYSDLANLVTEE